MSQDPYRKPAEVPLEGPEKPLSASAALEEFFVLVGRGLFFDSKCPKDVTAYSSKLLHAFIESEEALAYLEGRLDLEAGAGRERVRRTSGG